MNKELRLRIISGLALGILLFFFLFYAFKTLFVIITLLLLLVATYEFCTALIKKGLRILLPVTFLINCFAFLSLWFFWVGSDEQAFVFLIAMLLGIIFYSFIRRIDKFRIFLWHIVSLLWLTFPFYAFIRLRFIREEDSLGIYLILFLIITVASNDIFAYFGGKQFGKHLLAPKISPKKTIEGSLSGIAGGMISGFLYCYFVFPHFDLISFLTMSFFLIIASQIGDLAESKFKRYCGIKDSGGIIPGHGGVLDRIDAFLFSIPLFWCFLYFFGTPLS
ncbi:MAG: phosphatidate cytidylyltransferase [Deltaproteobacteria bacterium]|nr:phosphatidate cytidylyltransferase [Deltaproteobacteria bacterium]